MKFDRHIGSTAAEVPVKFQSDRTILNTNLAASRLYEILRKDVFSDIETGPWLINTQDNSYPGKIIPRATCNQGNSYPRQLIHRTTHTQDNSYQERLASKKTSIPRGVSSRTNIGQVISEVYTIAKYCYILQRQWVREWVNDVSQLFDYQLIWCILFSSVLDYLCTDIRQLFTGHGMNLHKF